MKIVVNTQELTAEDKAELISEHQQVGYFVFSSTENIKEDDVPDELIEFEGQKTPSYGGVVWKLAGVPKRQMN